jgi:hypothetical protein
MIAETQTSLISRDVERATVIPVAGSLPGYWIAVVLSVLLLSVPIWIVKYPGLIDYHNHLVGCYILAHYSENPFFQQHYAVVHEPIPNLAMELIVAPLARILDYRVAGKIFLELTLLVWAMGCHFLCRSIQGTNHWLAIAGILSFYSSSMLWGFVNYQFGLGVFLLGFAYWYSHREKPTAGNILVFGIFAIVAYLAHLTSYGLLVVCCGIVAALQLMRTHNWARFLRQTCVLALPLLMFVAFMHGTGRVGRIRWGTVQDQVTPLLAPLLSYSARWDVVALAVLVILVLLMRRGISWKEPVILAVVFLVLTLVSPTELLTVSGVAPRFVMPAFLLTLASMQLAPGRRTQVLVACLIGLFVAKNAQITYTWMKTDPAMSAMVQMGDRIAPGSSVYASLNSSDVPKAERALKQVCHYWMVDRKAFLPTLYAIPGQQPLNLKTTVCFQTIRADGLWKNCVGSYDYLLNPPLSKELEGELAQRADKIATVEDFTLWRVRHDQHVVSARVQ